MTSEELLNSKVQISLRTATSKFSRIFEGWNDEHGILLNGATGTVTEISDHPQYQYGSKMREEHLKDRGLHCLVKFDKEYHLPSEKNLNINISSFHFCEDELIILL